MTNGSHQAGDTQIWKIYNATAAQPAAGRNVIINFAGSNKLYLKLETQISI